jgi:FMN reductase
MFAAPENRGDAALTRRIDRAATELAALTSSGVTRTVVDGAWQDYRHDLGSAAQHASEGEELEGIDLDTDLMRLATGGGANSRKG